MCPDVDSMEPCSKCNALRAENEIAFVLPAKAFGYPGLDDRAICVFCAFKFTLPFLQGWARRDWERRWNWESQRAAKIGQGAEGAHHAG